MSDNEKTTQPASTDSTAPAYRYNAALAQDIEGKWQKIWDDKGTFWAANVNGDLKDGKGRNADGRPAYFAMDMFPYPSGKGLHVGHPLGYLASDVASRYHRMKGENVLHAMGYDAFGLPPRAVVDHVAQYVTDAVGELRVPVLDRDAVSLLAERSPDHLHVPVAFHGREAGEDGVARGYGVDVTDEQ